MKNAIAIVNLKGGVGKTTVTVNLATCLAKNYQKRVLLIDLDTQINATLSVMPPIHFAALREEKRTLKSLIQQITQPENPSNIRIKDVIKHNICQIQGLDIIPGDIDLYDDAELAMNIYQKAKIHRETFENCWDIMEQNLIRTILQPIIHDYDFIIIDFSPGDHLITRSGILASDYYIIPAKAEPLSVVGIGILEGRIRQFKDRKLTKIELLGISLTSLGRATKMADSIKNRLKEDFGEKALFETEIPLNVSVARAVDEFQPVVLTEPKSSGAKAFNQFTEEFYLRYNRFNKNLR
jgi:cellulose biosynthesis protein BcsQ